VNQVSHVFLLGHEHPNNCCSGLNDLINEGCKILVGDEGSVKNPILVDDLDSFVLGNLDAVATTPKLTAVIPVDNGKTVEA
jgi:hypothetical protein